MKTTPYLKICALALAGSLASCSSSSKNITRVNISSPSENGGSMPDKIFNKVNNYRASFGKKALKRHYGLDAMAQKHCEDLARKNGGNGLKINHNGFSGRALAARHAYSIPVLGENVAATTTQSAQGLLNAWKSSKNHEHNMRSSWTHTGIGSVVTDDGKVVSTQIFGTESDNSFVASKNRFMKH